MLFLSTDVINMDICARRKTRNINNAPRFASLRSGRSCVNLARMASMTNALPLSNATTYTGFDSTVTWDGDMVYGCVCDSSWKVGLASGETQEPEWFGADCSLRHCPSGNDPRTGAADETDCAGKLAKYGKGKGRVGNKCHVDCSNRGTCNYRTGQCACFDGYFGQACNEMSALAHDC